ncbi:hypothetical protein HK097_009983 [Rhizophlyctis rosea]|uniref:Uncharacterized protein n=1 Tax=Rhizophlyctis rosea TaxID=64517 RepID=A0AAD5SB10_9FUNG|nr:hypothetical protein HK097_009983 [Rhizophlyctis rosea]
MVSIFDELTTILGKSSTPFFSLSHTYSTEEPNDERRAIWANHRCNVGAKPLPSRDAPKYTWLAAEQDLERQLIKCGGWAVSMTNSDTLPFIITEGFLLDGEDADLDLGRPCGCHDNAQALHDENPEEIVVMMGYALSEDGMWRGHSWGLRIADNGFRIIETTSERVAYFGHILKPGQEAATKEEELELFARGSDILREFYANSGKEL